MNKVQILMPVYNGEKYLREQIDSFLRQTYSEWELLIRNDGSCDNSQLIIDEYCNKYPGKIRFIDTPKENIGLVRSLNVLLNQADADFIMFSDQDDIWLPEKMEWSLGEIQRIEKRGKPAMICTDVTCVDECGRTICQSLFQNMHLIDSVMGNKQKMLALNIIQGCTIMINKSAKVKIYPMPEYMRMHDMWIGAVVAHYGTTSYLHKQTMLYRQHNRNVVGSVSVNANYFRKRLIWLPRTIKYCKQLSADLPFTVNIPLVIYYKFFYSFKRLFV